MAQLQHRIKELWGVARECQGIWQWGFQQKIGLASNIMINILAIQRGLEECKRLKHDKVKMYTDSLEGLQLILSGCDESHPIHYRVDAQSALARPQAFVHNMGLDRKV